MSRNVQDQLATFGALLVDAAQIWDGALVGAAFEQTLQLQPPPVAQRPDERADTCRTEPRRCAVDLASDRHRAALASETDHYPRAPVSGGSSHSL